jgi:hypothetical protein
MATRLCNSLGDPTRAVSAAKMRSQITFFVEGTNDIRFFRQWLNEENGRIERASTKKFVKSVFKEAVRMPKCKEKVVCIADLDYELFQGTKPIVDSHFIYVSFQPAFEGSEVESNDIEGTLIRSRAFDKLMLQLVEEKDVDSPDLPKQVTVLREKLRACAAAIGSYRAADQRAYFKTGSSPIDGNFEIRDTFFSPSELAVDRACIRKLLAQSAGNRKSAMNEALDDADHLYAKYGGGWQLCRGHDLTEILATHLTAIGRRENPATIESKLRIAFEGEMIKGTKFGAQIRALEEELGRNLLLA